MAKLEMNYYHLKKATPDFVVLVILATAIFIASWEAYKRLSPAILDFITYNYWFEGDSAIYYRMMSERSTILHGPTRNHPLFSLITFPVTYATRRFLNVSSETAVGFYLATVATLWIGALFVLLRALRLKRLDAIVFCIVGAMSASAIFWFTVPETYPLAALGSVLVLSTVAFTERIGLLPVWWYTLISAGSLSVTKINWMAGLLMLFSIFRWKKALQIAIISFCLVVGASGIQKLIFPSAQFFMRTENYELNYIFHPLALGLLPTSNVLLFHSMVMPEIHEAYGTQLSVQGAQPGLGSLIEFVPTVIWVCLLILASWWFFSEGKTSKACVVLALTIIGNFLFYLVFSQETFLYTLQLTPLLVAFSALGVRTRLRPVVVFLAIVFAVFAGVNNIEKFLTASTLLNQRYERQKAFFEQIQNLVEPDSLIIEGKTPLQVGPPGSWRVKSDRPNPEVIPPKELDNFHRNGWAVYYEDWSIELVKVLQHKGAKYFVTSYILGLDQNSEFRQRMIEQYGPLERTPIWAIYRLD